MIQKVIFEGAKSKVRRTKFKFLTVAMMAAIIMILSGCPDGGATNPKDIRGDEAAATVNGKAIKFEEVERAIKQQARGQESKLSPLELAQARLQVLSQLIQEEVMYQKAESEQTIPTDDEVKAELNKNKTNSGLSQEEYEKKMKEAGETEESLLRKFKRQLAISKLVDKVSGKVEPPTDKEIEAFYVGNKTAFVKKRGVKLAAIVVDPRNNGQGDTTTNEAEASQKLKEIGQQLSQGIDFATIAREKSEDASRVRGGDLGYLSEDQLKQNYPQLAQGFMNPKFPIGRIAGPINIAGRFFIFKLQERIEKEENLTLESPGVRKQITDTLVNTRKQLLSASYAAIAMNDAKIENYLAKKVVDNPNELSGARPASVDKDSNSNSNSESNSNADSNANSNADKKADNKKSEDKKSDEKSKDDSKEKADDKKEDKK
jgi:parvulin-like peptidyl-prolyl isomerase